MKMVGRKNSVELLKFVCNFNFKHTSVIPEI